MRDDSHLKHSSIEKWTPQGQHGLTFVLPVQYTEVNEAIDITVRYIKMFHCILSALSNRAKLNQQWSPVVSTQGTAWWYLTWQTAHFKTHTHPVHINLHPHKLCAIQSSVIGVLCDGTTAACRQWLAADVCACRFRTIVASERTDRKHLR